MANILVIDPSRSMRSALKERLEHEGHEVAVAEDTISGMLVYAKHHFDLLLCGQPDSPVRVSTPWIRLSYDTSPDSAVLAMRQGAVGFVAKPVDMNRLLDAVRKGLASPVSSSAGKRAAQDRNGVVKSVDIIGESLPMRRMKEMIDKVAPTDARVLITGANGTGKELVARRLHERSRRSNGPFIEVNCAAIPSELIESELFGYEKGAFTSAVRQHKGNFEQADNGTLFLDEIGDMSLAAQAKVLRVLQEHRISRVGSDHDMEVNVRVVAATNKDIPSEISKGTFREDLFHRLSVIVIRVPSLSEHAGDIPMLVDYFLGVICGEYGMPVKSISHDAVEELEHMPWSGNIRELRNTVERLVILCGRTITLDDVRKYGYSLC